MKNAYAADEVQAFIEQNIAQARPLPSSDAETRRTRAEADRHDAELARKVLSAGGLDLERLDTLARERAHARRSRADKQRRRAVTGSASVDRWLTGLTPVLPIDPASMNVIIGTVTFIRTFADAGVVTDSHIGSLDNWARYELQSSSGATKTGTGRLSFFVLWRNPRTDPIVANVGPRVVVNAHLSVDADWNGVAAWFIGGSEARATVRARTTVLGLVRPGDCQRHHPWQRRGERWVLRRRRQYVNRRQSVRPRVGILRSGTGIRPDRGHAVDRVPIDERFARPRRRQWTIPGLGAAPHHHGHITVDL